MTVTVQRKIQQQEIHQRRSIHRRQVIQQTCQGMCVITLIDSVTVITGWLILRKKKME